jgi:hypothetical protein
MEIVNESQGDNLNTYFELGNNASANGNHTESIQWFHKGLAKAKELKNELKISEFSTLILFSL